MKLLFDICQHNCIDKCMKFEVFGFDWDAGNIEKCCKHGASIADIEMIFRKNPKIAPDNKHSGQEERFIAFGLSQNHRAMFVAFTLRENDGVSLIRPISARFMHDKEVIAYEKNS